MSCIRLFICLSVNVFVSGKECKQPRTSESMHGYIKMLLFSLLFFNTKMLSAKGTFFFLRYLDDTRKYNNKIVVVVVMEKEKSGSKASLTSARQNTSPGNPVCVVLCAVCDRVFLAFYFARRQQTWRACHFKSLQLHRFFHC